MSKDILLNAAKVAKEKGEDVKCILAARTETIEGETVVLEDEKEVHYTPEAIENMSMFGKKNISVGGRLLSLKKEEKAKLKGGKAKAEELEESEEVDTLASTANADGGDGPGGTPKA